MPGISRIGNRDTPSGFEAPGRALGDDGSQLKRVTAADLVAEGHPADDHGVVTDEAVRTVINLLALGVEGTELTTRREEVGVLACDRSTAGMSRSLI
jgi:hypothetical protein